MSRQQTSLNDIDLAQDQFRFRRGTPLHSSDIFPLYPLRPLLRPLRPLRRPLRRPPRCLVICPHVPDGMLVLFDSGILPASPLPRPRCVLHLHSHVAGILVHNLQSTNVAL